MSEQRARRRAGEPSKARSPSEARRNSGGAVGTRRTRRLGSSDDTNLRIESAPSTRPLLAHVIWAEYLGATLTSERNAVNIDILFAGLLLPTVVPLSWSLAELKRNIFKYIKKYVALAESRKSRFFLHKFLFSDCRCGRRRLRRPRSCKLPSATAFLQQ